MPTTIDRDWLDIVPAYGPHEVFDRILETALNDVLSSEELEQPLSDVFNSLSTAGKFSALRVSSGSGVLSDCVKVRWS